MSTSSNTAVSDKPHTKLSVVAFLYAKPGMEGQLGQRLMSLVAPSRAEAGCLNSERAALDLHFTVPYMRAILAELPQLLRAPTSMHYLSMRSEPGPQVERA